MTDAAIIQKLHETDNALEIKIMELRAVVEAMKVLACKISSAKR